MDAATERSLQVGDARLFVREVGQGTPLVVLHGGPSLDLGYLLPELDDLADTFRLITYDQRGRGRSTHGVVCRWSTRAPDTHRGTPRRSVRK